MILDLLIKGAKVCTPTGLKKTDICVRDRKITALPGPNCRAKAARVVDACGKTAIPGLVDPHVHFQLPIRPGLATIDDFRSGSLSAICGGVTTVIDYTAQAPGVPLEQGF